MKAALPIRNSIVTLAFVFLATASALADGLRTEDVTVVTKSGRHVFQSEIADTATTRSMGLMFRTSLAPDRAMLFDFGSERPVSMWMKNTDVALDMIFIAKSGTVTAIAENTVPQSTDVISPPGKAISVLETAAGTAKRIGLVIGDKVEHRIFGK